MNKYLTKVIFASIVNNNSNYEMKFTGKRPRARRRSETLRCPRQGENCKWIVSLETPG
jgi:hypothetical protein